MGHEVVVFQVLAPGEQRLAAAGDVEFVDLETGDRMVASTPAVRDAYEQRVRAFVEAQRAFALAEGMTFVDVATDRPLDAVLRAFTQQRAAQAGGGR